MQFIRTIICNYALKSEWDSFDSVALNKYAITQFALGELLAFYRGEEVTPSAINAARRRFTINPATISEEIKSIIFNCSDGLVDTKLGAATWRRFSQYIDDYLQEYPDQVEIAIPYPSEVVKIILNQKVGVHEISKVIGCLAHLNPKCGLAYLDYDLKNMTMKECELIFNSLSANERRIVRAYRDRTSSPFSSLPVFLPGNENDIVSMVPHVWSRGNKQLVTQLLTSYPSFLTVWMMKSKQDGLLNTLLTSTYDDVSVDHDGRVVNEVADSEGLTATVVESVLGLTRFNLNLTKAQVRILLGRIGITSSIIGNEGCGPGPYLRGLHLASAKKEYSEISNLMTRFSLCTRQMAAVVMWEHGILE